jgi:hypothetical protein
MSVVFGTHPLPISPSLTIVPLVSCLAAQLDLLIDLGDVGLGGLRPFGGPLYDDGGGGGVRGSPSSVLGELSDEFSKAGMSSSRVLGVGGRDYPRLRDQPPVRE